MPRKIDVKKGCLSITENVEVIYEATVTQFGNSAKIGAPKKYIEKSLRHHYQRIAQRRQEFCSKDHFIEKDISIIDNNLFPVIEKSERKCLRKK
jgi:putative transposon-encoded protein